MLVIPRKLVLLCTLALFAQLSFAQQTDDEVKRVLSNTPAGSGGKQIITLGKQMLGLPYVAGVLERNSKEQLVCNVEELDCWTFVEQTLALYLTKQTGSEDVGVFKKNLQQLRYRNGKINGYGSRLHYFFEWLLQAEKNGFLDSQMEKLGGKPYNKTIDFMSTHVQLYPKLSDQESYETVLAAEAYINHQTWTYIPKADIKNIENQLEDGDFIAITTSKEGLDVSHEGFAIRQNGRIHLLHASQELKKVVMTSEPLVDYLAKHKSQTGIVVARVRK